MGSHSAGVDEHRSIEALLVSEERHRVIAENALDVIWTMAPDGSITSVSPAVERLRGYTVAEAMAQPLPEILTPESAAVSAGYFMRMLEGIARGERPEPFKGEMEYLCKDGSTVWCEVRAYPILSADGGLVELLGVSRDLSERKRYEQELLAAHDQTRAANAELLEAREARTRRFARRSDYVARAQHVLRTDLSLVMGWTDMLADDFESLGPEQKREALAAIQRNMRTLMGHLQLLMTEASETWTAETMNPEPVDLAPLVRDVVADYAAVHRDVAVSASVAASLLVLGSVEAVRTLLRHLVENAVRHAISAVEVTAAGREDGRWVELVVRDDGPGLPAGVDIFEAFTTGGHGSGHGLGLHVVRTLVEAMGGDVRAADRGDRGGAEFTVRLKAVSHE